MRLTAPFGPGYPTRVRPPFAEIVAEGLAADDPARVYLALLDTLRTTWRADRALLARAGIAGGETAIVCRSPATSRRGTAFDPSALAPAFDASAPVVIREPGDGTVLAVGLRPRDQAAWCVALARKGGESWTAAERGAFAEAAPYLTIVLENVLSRAALVEAQDREAKAATEHERLLSVISHELRNPLAPILMWTSTLKRLRPDDPEVKRATQAIANAVALERRLIDDLLDLSRLERGTLAVALEQVDVREIARRAIESHRAAAEQNRLTVEETLPPDPVVVRADVARLGQVVGAVVDNAIKFTPPDGRITLAVASRTGEARITITDSGPGIPREVADRLFTPFVQGPNARGGLGVGLAVARDILALHRGRIEVESTPDGTVVVVTLPLKAA